MEYDTPRPRAHADHGALCRARYAEVCDIMTENRAFMVKLVCHVGNGKASLSWHTAPAAGLLLGLAQPVGRSSTPSRKNPAPVPYESAQGRGPVIGSELGGVPGGPLSRTLTGCPARYAGGEGRGVVLNAPEPSLGAPWGCWWRWLAVSRGGGWRLSVAGGGDR